MLCTLHFRACQGGELWQRKIPRRPSNSRLTQCTQKFSKLVCLIPTALAKCCRAYGTATPFFVQLLGFASRMGGAETSTYARVASTDCHSLTTLGGAQSGD